MTKGIHSKGTLFSLMASTQQLQDLDKKYLWHPFTQMKDWCAADHEPLVLVSGDGALLRDSEGREYLDGNSSIWTNTHGHCHPYIDSAIRHQMDQLAHCSALGFSNEPAIRLAEKLIALFPEKSLSRVFFTDDGSTSIECACKMAIQYRQLSGQPHQNEFLSFDKAYHGDTAGAASLGGIGSFIGRFQGTGFAGKSVPDFAALAELGSEDLSKVTAVCIEPIIQGAAGMKIWPSGMLQSLRKWCDQHDIFLIFDEVMTGFGRTGKMFAHEHEEVIPDFLCLAKGITGGYMPLAATLTTEKVFSAFLGDYDETFFYGHSYCANPLGCAAAIANLELFEAEGFWVELGKKIDHLSAELARQFVGLKEIAEIRQKGLIAGIEIETADWREMTGAKVSLAARKHGLLTRPVRDTLVLMPPLCSTKKQITLMVEAIRLGLNDVYHELSR